MTAEWLALGIFMLGAACGALLTFIHFQGLRSRKSESGHHKTRFQR
jgi:hypothetical protein